VADKLKSKNLGGIVFSQLTTSFLRSFFAPYHNKDKTIIIQILVVKAPFLKNDCKIIARSLVNTPALNFIYLHNNLINYRTFFFLNGKANE